MQEWGRMAFRSKPQPQEYAAGMLATSPPPSAPVHFNHELRWGRVLDFMAQYPISL